MIPLLAFYRVVTKVHRIFLMLGGRKDWDGKAVSMGDIVVL